MFNNIKNNLKNNKKLIIISLLIIIILILYFKNIKRYIMYNFEKFESILNIKKIYNDISGTNTFNNVETNNLFTKDINIADFLKVNNNNIDISGNITVNNLKVFENLNIGRNLNLNLKLNIKKPYYVFQMNGRLDDLYKIKPIIVDYYTPDMYIIDEKWWVSDRKILENTNGTISANIKDGKIYGFDKNKTYNLEASIQLHITCGPSPTDLEIYVVRWENNNGNELSRKVVHKMGDLADSITNISDITLKTNIFATGSDKYILTLQSYGRNNIRYRTDISVIIIITEI